MIKIDYESYIDRFRTENDMIIEKILSHESSQLQHLFEMLTEKILIDNPADDKEVINHTRDVIILANQLMDIREEFSLNEKKIVFGAVILHDYFKYQYKKRHAIKAEELLGEPLIKKSFDGSEGIVITIIQSHDKEYDTGMLDSKTKEMCYVLKNADKISKLFKHRNWTQDGEYSSNKIEEVISEVNENLYGQIAKDLFKALQNSFYEHK